jgi:hypothetical protein
MKYSAIPTPINATMFSAMIMGSGDLSAGGAEGGAGAAGAAGG